MPRGSSQLITVRDFTTGTFFFCLNDPKIRRKWGHSLIWPKLACAA